MRISASSLINNRRGILILGALCILLSGGLLSLVSSLGTEIILALTLMAAGTIVVFWVAVYDKTIWFLYLLSFIIPFSQPIPISAIAGRTFHIGFDTVLIIFIVVVYITQSIIIKRTRFVITRALIWLLVLWFWNMMLLLLSIYNLSGLSEADAIIVFIRWSQYIPIFILIIGLDLPTRKIRTFIYIFVVSAVIVAVLNLIESRFIGIDTNVIRGAALVTRGYLSEGIIGNYNVVAAYLAMAIALFLPFALTARGFRKLLMLLLIVIILTGSWVSTSRSGLLAILVGFIFAGIFFFPRSLLMSSVVGIPILIVVIWQLADTRVVQGFAKFQYIPQALPLLTGVRLESLGLPLEAGGAVLRLSFWGRTIGLISESPIWGLGYRATRWSKGPADYFTADNYFLELLADTGLIGFLITSIFLLTLLIYAARLYGLARSLLIKKFAIGYLTVLITLIFINLFAGMFTSQKIWGPFLILSALVCNQLQRATSVQARNKHNLQVYN